MKQKLLFLLVLLLTATTGAWAQDYYAPSTDEVIILNEVYNASKSGYSSHSAIAWGGSATTSNKKAGDPNNGGQQTSSHVICYSVKGTGQGKNITLSITGVSKVIVYHEKHTSRYIELRDGSKTGNIIGSGEKNTNVTEVELTATNKYSIFLHGTSTGSDDADFYVYAIELIAAPAASGYTVSLKDGVKDADKWTVKAGTDGSFQSLPLKGVKAGTKVKLKYDGDRSMLKGVTAVKAVKKAGNAYLKWDADQKKLVATPMPESFTTVTSSTTNWSAGTYVVEGQVDINRTVELSGDVNLIIKDGAKLTVDHLYGNSHNLSIYGQAQMTGELDVSCSGGDAINEIPTLEVHSAKVTATSSESYGAGFGAIGTFNVYGGLVDAKGTAAEGGCGICLSEEGSMNIYGGEVKAEGKGIDSDSYGITCIESLATTLKVYGGKLWAGCADNSALVRRGINLTKNGGFNGKIETSNDDKSWEEYDREIFTSETKYVRVGY